MDLWAEAAPCLKDVLFLPNTTRALLLLLSGSSQSILTSSFCRVWRRWYAPCAGSLIFSPPCSRSWLTSRVIGTSPALASRYKRGMRSSRILGEYMLLPFCIGGMTRKELLLVARVSLALALERSRDGRDRKSVV